MEEEMEMGTQETEPIQGGRESVLLVDDEQPVLSVIRKMLERLGYRVDGKNSGIDALDAFHIQSMQYDLLIADLTKPNMNGLELAKQLSKTRPELPVILMTGYGEEVTKEIQKQYAIREIISKPIEIKALASIVRKAIDK